MKHTALLRQELAFAKKISPGSVHLSAAKQLEFLVNEYGLSVIRGDLLFLSSRWYVTHSGLLRLAYRKRCYGLHTQTIGEFCDARPRDGHSKRSFTSLEHARASLVTGTPIHPTFHRWSAALKCASPKRVQ